MIAVAFFSPVQADNLTRTVTDNSADAISDVLEVLYGGAELVLPVVSRGRYSTFREGAVHTGINGAISSSNGGVFNHLSSTSVCTPGTELLEASDSFSSVEIQYDFEASGGINLEVQDIFSLFTFQASQIESFGLKIEDSQIVSVADNFLRTQVGVQDLFDNDEVCREQVFCGPRRTYVINSVVVGKIEMSFLFKQSAEASLVEAVVERIGLKVGANFEVERSVTADGQERAVFSSGDRAVGFAATRQHWSRILPNRSC